MHDAPSRVHESNGGSAGDADREDGARGREGRWVYYRLADDRVRALLRIAQELMADHAQALLSCAVVSPDVPGAAVHGIEEDIVGGAPRG